MQPRPTREALCASYLPAWGANVEKQIGSGPFFGGAEMNVVDIKLHMAVRWLAGGKLDYIPATIFAGFPKLVRLHDAVRDDARIKSWYARG